MSQKLFTLILISTSLLSFGQKKSIDRLLQIYNRNTVDYISVQALRMKPEAYIILDTRQKEEYEISHIPNAIWVGTKPEKNEIEKYLRIKKPVVLYCTVGIRSERYGEKLDRKGDQKIFNLYGGIFAWKDAGYDLRDVKEKPTLKVHTFSKNWEDYLKTGIAVH